MELLGLLQIGVAGSSFGGGTGGGYVDFGSVTGTISCKPNDKLGFGMYRWDSPGKLVESNSLWVSGGGVLVVYANGLFGDGNFEALGGKLESANNSVGIYATSYCGCR